MPHAIVCGRAAGGREPASLKEPPGSEVGPGNDGPDPAAMRLEPASSQLLDQPAPQPAPAMARPNIQTPDLTVSDPCHPDHAIVPVHRDQEPAPCPAIAARKILHVRIEVGIRLITELAQVSSK